MFTWKRLNLVIIPIIILIFLFSLQMVTQLKHIQKLPTPGWSRALEPSSPLLTSVVPYIQETNGQFDLYTATPSAITRTRLDHTLKKVDQARLPVKGTVQSIILATGSDLVFEQNNSLMYETNKQTALITKKWEHVTAIDQKVIYSESLHLYDYQPALKKSSEIAGFAAPVSSLSATNEGQALIVTTFQKKTHQYTFFLLKDQGDIGYQVFKLGWIKPKAGQSLQTCQITTTPKKYFILIAFKNEKNQTALESVQISKAQVTQGTIGQPKAQPFIIKEEGQTVQHFLDLSLSQTSGNPSLLYVGGSNSPPTTIFMAHSTKSESWVAEPRSSNLTAKTQPMWVDQSHQLITWLTPKPGALSTIQFSIHDPQLAKKSLQIHSIDLIHAMKKTHQNFPKMGQFLLMLLLFGIPALIVYGILAFWNRELAFSKSLILASTLIFLISEIDWIWQVLHAATLLPSYLSLPFSPIIYGVGGAVLSFLAAYWLSPSSWSRKAKLTYSLTLFCLWITFLVGPYF